MFPQNGNTVLEYLDHLTSVSKVRSVSLMLASSNHHYYTCGVFLSSIYSYSPCSELSEPTLNRLCRMNFT